MVRHNLPSPTWSYPFEIAGRGNGKRCAAVEGHIMRHPFAGVGSIGGDGSSNSAMLACTRVGGCGVRIGSCIVLPLAAAFAIWADPANGADPAGKGMVPCDTSDEYLTGLIQP